MYRYFKFRLNDKVIINNNEDAVFKVVGYKLEKNFYPEEISVMYELYCEYDGIMANVEEDNLSFFKGKRRISKYIEDDINKLLDEYNDNQFLFEMFGDNTYEKKMRIALTKMKNIQK